MKRFLKIFALLLVSELIFALPGLFLSQGIAPRFAETIGNIIMAVISLPLSLINRSWSFYAQGRGASV